MPRRPANGARYHFLSAGEEVYGGKAHGGFFPLPGLCCLCFAGRQARFSFANRLRNMDSYAASIFERAPAGRSVVPLNGAQGPSYFRLPRSPARW